MLFDKGSEAESQMLLTSKPLVFWKKLLITVKALMIILIDEWVRKLLVIGSAMICVRS